MNVTKVKTTRDCALFEKLYLKDSVFYITPPYRKGSSTIYYSDVFGGKDNLLIGSIRGYWFDFDNKTLFKEVKE